MDIEKAIFHAILKLWSLLFSLNSLSTLLQFKTEGHAVGISWNILYLFTTCLNKHSKANNSNAYVRFKC
jgi:hypothetical protein